MCSRLMFSESILIPGKNQVHGGLLREVTTILARTLVECLLKSLI